MRIFILSLSISSLVSDFIFQQELYGFHDIYSKTVLQNLLIQIVP